MNMRIHYNPYNAETGENIPVVAISDEVTSTQALNNLKTSLKDVSHEVVFIEDMDMKPVLDKMIHLMQHAGLSVGGRYHKSLITYYCYQDKFYYSEGMPNPAEGTQLEEHELRERLQAHYTSLDEEERTQDIQYVEEKYAEFTEKENPAPAFDMDNQGVFFHMEHTEVFDILYAYDDLCAHQGLTESQVAMCRKLYESLSETHQRGADEVLCSLPDLLKEE